MLTVALKEWAVVCELLAAGRQAILLRKGGIHEASGPGVFELEHARFGLFPSWAHQNRPSIKPAHQHQVETLPEPQEVTLTAVAEVARLWRVPSRAQFDELDDLHCWAPSYLDMRFGYKPDRPLYLIGLRVSRLAQPKAVLNSPEYAGCRSWVALQPQDAIDEADATPVADEPALQGIFARIDKAFARGSASPHG